MRKLLLTLVVGLSLTLISGLATAQQNQGTQKSDTLKVGKSHQMMMSKQEEKKQQNLQPRRTMGNKMMKKGSMGCKTMMQGHMGKGMMHGKMNSDMGMSDPIIKMLHSAGCPGFLLKAADKLELTDAQITKLNSLKSDLQKFAVQKNADIKVAKIELSELLGAEGFDSRKIKSQISKIESLQSDLRLEFLKTIEQSRGLLTPEQTNTLRGLSNGCGMGMMKHNMMK